MEALGLMPSSTGAPEGKRHGYKMSHYIIPGGAFERAFNNMPSSCQLPWTCGIDEDSVGKKKKEKKGQDAARKVKLKYSCPTCELNVWGRAGLSLRCDDCDQQLVTVDAADKCAAPVRKAA